MNSDELERAYSDFIDGEVYDAVEDALFQLVRQAFVAGWRAAKWDSIQLVKE